MANESNCAYPTVNPLPVSSNLYLTTFVVLSWALHSTLKQKVPGTDLGYPSFFLSFLRISIRLITQNNIYYLGFPLFEKKFKGTLIFIKFKIYELLWKTLHIMNPKNHPITPTNLREAMVPYCFTSCFSNTI